MPEQNTDMHQAAKLLALQRNEITEYHIYTKIAAVTPEPGNRDVLMRIAQEELGHYHIWRRYTLQDVEPDRLRILLYSLAARIFGMTFTIRLMEGVEQRAQAADRSLTTVIPEMPQILANEASHERDLMALLDEERLKYVGSIVLGLNDALVEFTGTLAGLTLAGPPALGEPRRPASRRASSRSDLFNRAMRAPSPAEAVRLALAEDPTYNHYRAEVVKFLHERHTRPDSTDAQMAVSRRPRLRLAVNQ